MGGVGRGVGSGGKVASRVVGDNIIHVTWVMSILKGEKRKFP